VKFIVYNRESGEVLRRYEVPSEIADKQHNPETEAIKVGDYPLHRMMVVDGAVIPFPEQATVYDPATTTLKNLPAPCSVRINCTEYECNESECTINFDQPGEYHIRITAPLYQDKELTVEYQPS
jgi:hypothetical protein